MVSLCTINLKKHRDLKSAVKVCFSLSLALFVTQSICARVSLSVSPPVPLSISLGHSLPLPLSTSSHTHVPRFHQKPGLQRVEGVVSGGGGGAGGGGGGEYAGRRGQFGSELEWLALNEVYVGERDPCRASVDVFSVFNEVHGVKWTGAMTWGV